MSEINRVLSKIQKELKAPKNQYNGFGKYKYRNCEDILEGLKPHLDNETNLTITDEIHLIGDRHYVKATVTLRHKGESITASAYAREAEQKKGMDSAQVTGATSSYARKYALNGLFCIDDTKDADSMDNSTNYQKPKPQNYAKPAPSIPKKPNPIEDKTLTDLRNLCSQYTKKFSDKKLNAECMELIKIKSWDELNHTNSNQNLQKIITLREKLKIPC